MKSTDVRFALEGEVNPITGTYFPTSIAVGLCVPVDLYPVKHPGSMKEGSKKYAARKEVAMKKVLRLKWFQELSMHGDFEEAMVAYYKIKLDKQQKKVLEVVNALTARQARGHMANAIFKKLKTCESRDMKSLGELLISLQATEGLEGGEVGKGFEALIINATKPS